MRHALRAFGLFVLTLGLGCAQDKYKMRPEFPEQYVEPPNEARYNQPDKATYRKPLAPAKDDKAMMNGGGRPGAPGLSPGGF